MLTPFLGLDVEYLDCLQKIFPGFDKVKLFGQTTRGFQPSLDPISSHTSYKSWNEANPPGTLVLRKAQGLDLRVLHESLLRLVTANFSSLHPVTASFLFDSQNRRRDPPAALFASLSIQLLYKRPGLFLKVRHLYRAFVTNRDWTERQLWVFFRTLLSQTNEHQFILVISGLQECEDSLGAYREDLLMLLQTMEGRMHIIFTYESKDVLMHGPSHVTFEIDLDGLDTSTTSKGYLEELIDFGTEKSLTLGEFKREIIRKLDDPSATYSLWARAYLNRLETSRRPSTLRAFHEELESFSLSEPHSRVFSKPNTTYLKNLWRPSKDRLYWAERALAWVSCSCRPLTMSELATALAIDSDVSIDDEVARDIAGDLRESLAGFFEIAGDEIRVAHASVRDFEVHSTHNTGERRSARQEAHHLLFQECRSYLVRVNQAYDASRNELRDENGKSSSLGDTIRDDLLDYSTEYWHVHYRLAKISDTDGHDVIDLLNNSQHLQMWEDADLKCILRDLSFEYTLDQLKDCLLCKCSYFGLLCMTEKITDPSSHLEEVDLMASLLLAVRRGHTNFVKRIVQYRPVRQPECETARLRASESGHGEICQVLIGLTTKDFIQRNMVALFSNASMHCDTEAVKCLLDRCEDETELKRNLTLPLHMACEYGFSSIVDLLLATGCIEIDETNTEGKTALHFAAENGHSAVIQSLLSHNPVVNLAIPGDLETPLHLASKYGHVEAARLLLSHGADPNLKTRSGRTALHFVGFGGSCAVAKALLDEKADINMPDDEKESVLHIAIGNGHEKRFKFLLDHGDVQGNIEHSARPDSPHEINGLRPSKLDLNVVNKSGRTPLIIAMYKNLEQFALHLIERGANLGAKDSLGQSALIIASRRGYTTVVKALLAQSADPNAVDVDHQTPLHVASENGHYQIVRILLDFEADVSAKDIIARTPMHLACTGNHLETVQELLKKTPDLHCFDSVDVEAWMPLTDVVELQNEEIVEMLLHYAGRNAGNFFGDSLQQSVLGAARVENEKILGLLLDAGADINFQDDYGNTALQLAAWYLHSKNVLLLLARRVNLELRDREGNTALSDAAAVGSMAISKLLLDAGAEKDARNNHGLTPLLRAATAGNEQIVRLLLERGADAFSADSNYGDLLQLSVANYSPAIVKVLLDRGADINSVDRQQGSILQIAIANNRKDTVDLLLEEKADIHQVCPDKGTALQVAVESGKRDMVELLLDRGANVNEGGGKFGNALNTLIHHWPENLELLQLLIENGADVDKCDSQGRLPIHFAAHQDNLSLVTRWKANIDCIDNQGRLPIHFAAAGGALRVLRYLLKHGIACNRADDDGWTPLHWACKQARPRVVLLLLEHGADVSARDFQGTWTPRDVALFHDNADVLKLPDLPTADDRSVVKSAGMIKRAYCDGCFCVSL